MEIRILGVPVFEGCNIRGVEKAPKVLRESNVFDSLKKRFNVVDQGDVEMLPSSETTMLDANPSVKYYDILLDMSNKICDIVKNNLLEEAFTIVVGGDHSVGAGSVAGTSIALNQNLGVIWYDAHSDINTPLTSPSKNFHGMPLAASMYIGADEMRSLGVDKRKVRPVNTFLIDARSMDIGEREIKDVHGINHYTTSYIRKRGMEVVADEVIETLRKNGVDNIHFSFDLDSISPEYTSAYNCPVADGMSVEDTIIFIKRLFSSGCVRSMDYTEYNPDRDTDGSGLNIAREIFDAISESMPDSIINPLKLNKSCG